jgi:3-deoxy-7-phosphoheptulonate synthase
MKATDDLRIKGYLPLTEPGVLKQQIPVTAEAEQTVVRGRQDIEKILLKNDRRLLAVVGPCSIHDEAAAIEYATRLNALRKKVSDTFSVVMRIYFEKPRTSLGWKGMINDPCLDGSCDMLSGLRKARSLLLKINALGLPAATEMLDTITAQYIADLVSWAAIGARTTESQTHRQMASGLSKPLGFKNGTPGTIGPAINAIKAARQPQTFLGISGDGVASAVSTTGNPNCHLVLRGGDRGPNYAAEHVADAERRLEEAGLEKTIVIDCSHGNSGKDPDRQPGVLRDVVAQRASGTRSIVGAMLESNLLAGNQPFPRPRDALVYGQSITDGCIDWETTERLVLEVADKC